MIDQKIKTIEIWNIDCRKLKDFHGNSSEIKVFDEKMNKFNKKTIENKYAEQSTN